MTDTPWGIINARITRVIDRLDALPTFREATVAATSPLAVRFDTDSVDTLVFATLVSGLAVGDRVLTLRFGRLPWVIGRRGGQVDTGWQPAGGTLGSGVTAYRALQYRIVDGIVYWSGQLFREGGWQSGTNTVITGIAQEARPGMDMPLTVTYDVGNISAYMGADGTLRLYSAGGPSSAWPIIGGSYPKD